MSTERSKLEELKEMGWDVEDIAQLLKELLAQLGDGATNHSRTEAELSITQKVTILMRKMGFGANLKGFEYLRDAISYCAENGTDMYITQELYPAVAKKFKTTPSRVERAIRHSIERAYDNGSPDLLELTGYTVSSRKGKPTNSEFIALVADEIRQNLL